MKSVPSYTRAASLKTLPLVAALLALGACAGGSSSSGKMATTAAPKTDPRVGLKAGVTDAGQAAWNLQLVSNTPSSEKFHGVTNSDLAFTGNYAIQGNYNGFQIWDISNPAAPTLKVGLPLPRLAERRVGLQEPAVRFGRGHRRPARLRRPGRARTP